MKEIQQLLFNLTIPQKEHQNWSDILHWIETIHKENPQMYTY